MSYYKCPACGYHAYTGAECFDCGYRGVGFSIGQGVRVVACCIALAILLTTTTGCSALSSALGALQGVLDTRMERTQRGFELEGYVTCDAKPEIHFDGNRWCARALAPTYADCEGGGQVVWFGDSLSGAGRSLLFDLCKDSAIGERWPHIDGVFEGGRLVARDANRGSKPL